MCGVAGFVTRSGTPERDRLEKMAVALAHRGPDASETAVYGEVGLAHTRLAIVGLGESGRQPCGGAERGWALSFNGEIFNHQQLRAQFAPREYIGTGDNETLLAGLCERGLDLLPELNGFFAFAAIDFRARRLYLVRDRYGVKPMYYAHDGERFLFASEQKAILAAGFEPALNDERFRYHTARVWANGAETCLGGISKLMPGCLLELDLDSFEWETRQWFSLHDLAEPDLQRELRAGGRGAASDLLERTLEDAVRRRLSSEIPVACLCSGGIDSSLVAALANRIEPGMPAYVLTVPEHPHWDELPYAKAAADAIGLDLVEVPVTGETWRREFAGLIAHFEYPFWIESGVGLGMLARKARSDGFRVLVGGEGSDEVFGGYDYKHAADREAAHREIGGEAPELTFDESSWPVDPPIDKLFGVSEPPASHEEYRARQQAEAAQGFSWLGGERAKMTAAFVSELRLFLEPSMTKLDKSTMRHSVEMREPFLDAELVRLGVNMPLEWLHYPKAKGILRDVAARHLPALLLERSKIGFSLDPAPFVLGHAKPEFLLEGMLREVLGIKKDWKLLKFLEDGEHRGRSVCRVLGAEVWLRHFIGGQSIDAIEAALWR